jgi:phage major head subunit gpT-like protein
MAAINVGFTNVFQQGWAQGAQQIYHPKLATRVSSSHASQVYGAMARLPAMREWLGARVFNNIAGHAQTIVNRTFEDSVAVGREEIEDEQLGWATMTLQELGRAGAKWPDQLLRSAMQDNPTGFDGLAYFHAAHTLDPAGTQSNLFALALTSANYASVREAMMAFRGEDGQPLGIMPNMLVVPPQLEGEARIILNADFIVDPGGASAAITNVWKGSAELLTIPELASEPTAWYLFDTSRALKPWIWQVRREVQLTSRTSLTDENVFNLNRFEWGIDGRGAVGPGPWFLGAQGNV